eukprot:m.321968 g.321968  ORF g.321968 m.321968 type:complete len:85 (+) comp16530_c1_seq36:5196-5450(+)
MCWESQPGQPYDDGACLYKAVLHSVCLGSPWRLFALICARTERCGSSSDRGRKALLHTGQCATLDCIVGIELFLPLGFHDNPNL